MSISLKPIVFFLISSLALIFVSLKAAEVGDASLAVEWLDSDEWDLIADASDLLDMDGGAAKKQGPTSEAHLPESRPDISSPDIPSFESHEYSHFFREEGYPIVLDPVRSAMLSALVISPVVKVTKKMGDRVRKGELLIELEATTFAAAYEKARAALAKAQTELVAKRELFKDRIASTFEVKEAEAAVASALADVASTKKSLSDTKILAPYDGKVVSLFVEEAELPHSHNNRNENREMIELIDDQTLVGKMLLPSSLIMTMHVGDLVRIRVKETGKTVETAIKRIGAAIDPSSATVKVEVEIDNREGQLLAGMSGVAVIEPPQQQAGRKEVSMLTKDSYSSDTWWDGELERLDRGFDADAALEEKDDER